MANQFYNNLYLESQSNWNKLKYLNNGNNSNRLSQNKNKYAKNKCAKNKLK